MGERVGAHGSGAGAVTARSGTRRDRVRRRQACDVGRRRGSPGTAGPGRLRPARHASGTAEMGAGAPVNAPVTSPVNSSTSSRPSQRPPGGAAGGGHRARQAVVRTGEAGREARRPPRRGCGRRRWAAAGASSPRGRGRERRRGGEVAAATAVERRGCGGRMRTRDRAARNAGPSSSTDAPCAARPAAPRRPTQRLEPKPMTDAHTGSSSAASTVIPGAESERRHRCDGTRRPRRPRPAIEPETGHEPEQQQPAREPAQPQQHDEVEDRHPGLPALLAGLAEHARRGARASQT